MSAFLIMMCHTRKQYTGQLFKSFLQFKVTYSSSNNNNKTKTNNNSNSKILHFLMQRSSTSAWCTVRSAKGDAAAAAAIVCHSLCVAVGIPSLQLTVPFF